MRVKEHLLELPEHEAAAFGRIIEGLQSAPCPETSSQMVKKILAAAAESENRYGSRFSPGPKPGTTPSWWIFGAAAAVLVIGFFVSSILDFACKEQGARDVADSWLAQTQEADGAWTPSRFGGLDAYRYSISALCAMALARDPHQPEAVDRTLAFLKVFLDRREDQYRSRADAYNAALSAYAFALLAADGDQAAMATLKSEVLRLRSSQTPSGGWDYEQGASGNAAITSWNAKVLALAEKRGIGEAALPLRKALRWLRDAVGDGNAVCYRQGGAIGSECLAALTAHALLTAGSKYGNLTDLGRYLVMRLDPNAAETADAYRSYAKIIAFDAAGEGGCAAVARKRMASCSGDDVWGKVGGRLYGASLRKLVLAGNHR